MTLPSSDDRNLIAMRRRRRLTHCRSIALSVGVALFALTSTASAQWIESLPRDIRDSIVWSADHEQGNLHQWQSPAHKYPGGGILNTGGAEVSATATEKIAHSGKFSAAASIKGAYRAQNGKRAVRLMRWTDRPWDDGGQYLPKDAFYSTWIYFPHNYSSKKHAPWDPGDGGWWNIFQFKANDEKDVSEPMFVLGAYFNEGRRQIELGLTSHYGRFQSFDQRRPVGMPIGKWVHLEAHYVVSHSDHGSITIWQDGQQLFDIKNVRTAITLENENAVWGVGNYTDHIAGGPKEGSATLYFDDAIISKKRVGESLMTSRR